MAISDKQKNKIVFYLGWSGLTLVDGSTQYNSVVNDRLDDASANDVISSLIKDILDKLELIDEDLEKARCRLSAKSVDNITLRDDEIRQLLKERKRCIRELSDHLDIPIMRSSGNSVNVCV